MTPEARLMCGTILITVPSIQYGGYFLLTLLTNRRSGYIDNPLRQNFFRAGHAHAGVFIILALICQMLADAAALPFADESFDPSDWPGLIAAWSRNRPRTSASARRIATPPNWIDWLPAV